MTKLNNLPEKANTKSRTFLLTLCVLLLSLVLPRLSLATSASISVSGTEGYATISASGSFTNYEHCDDPNDPSNCQYNDGGGIRVYHVDPVWGESRLAIVGGQGSASWSGQTDLGRMDQGSHIHRVTATDSEGATATETATVVIDNTPSVVLDSPGEVRGGGIDITGAVTFKSVGDPGTHEGSIYFYLDGNRLEWNPYGVFGKNYSLSYEALSGKLIDAGQLSNGEHTFSVNVSSANGVGASDSVTFTVDNTPSGVVNSPGVVKGGLLDFTGSVNFTDVNEPSECDGYMTLYLDGNRLNTNKFYFYTTDTEWRFSELGGQLVNAGLLANGEHIIGAHITSRSGVSIWEQATFTVDNTPRVTVNSPGSVNSPFDITGNSNFAEVPDGREGYLHLFIDDVRIGNRLPIYETDKNWSYSEFAGQLLDISAYSEGEHTIQIVGESLLSEYSSAIGTFTVTNLVLEKNQGVCGLTCKLRTMVSSAKKTLTQTFFPINYSTGNKYKRQVDFQLSGIGAPFGFERFYNSHNEAASQFGYGWKDSYSHSLTLSGNTIILKEADGAQIHFKDNGQGTFISEAYSFRKIVAVTNGHTLSEPDGSILAFNADGKLIQIVDRNGNTKTITHTAGNISTVTDNFGRSITFQYNAQNQLTTLVTPVGNYIYTYDANNNLARVDNPDNTFKTYIYDDPNDIHNLTGIINEKGIRELFVAYDTQDRATVSERANSADRVEVVYDQNFIRQITDSLGNTTTIKLHVDKGIGRVKSSSGAGCGSCLASLGESYELNDRLQMSQETDGEGNITTYTYDDRGNVLTKTEAVGTPEERTTTYTYRPDYALVATITRQSVANPGSDTVTTFMYDTNGNLTGTTVTGYSDGAQTSITTGMTYNSSGQITSVDGPKAGPADTVTYEYYPNDAGEGLNRGQLKKVIDPLGRETIFAGYNAYGKPQSVTDINGIITTLIYDAVGRLTHSTRNGQTTVYGYDAIGQLTSLDLPNGQQITYTYDDAGNNIRITDTLGNYIAYTYNTEGKRTREEVHDATDALKKYTDFDYDTVNRLWKTIYPDTTYAELLYDNNNQVTQLTDANGKVTSQVYDALKRLTHVTQPGTTVTTYGYDAHDNLASVTDAENLTTTYQYDDFGRVAFETSPDTGTTTYTYDEAGNLTSKTDANGTVITYTYDLLNRLTGVSFTDAAQDITYTYDEGVNGLGRLTGMSDPSGTYVYGYDADGNLVSEEKTVAGVTYTTGYDYDEAGLLTGMTYPDGRTITYVRDDSGNVTAVTTTKDSIISVVAQDIAYLPFGPLSDMTLGNGLAQARGYDQLYRAASRQVPGFQDLVYDLDAVGNITDITDQITAAASQTFGYDDLYRLTNATGLYGTIGYTYDKVGNRLTRTLDGQTETYAYEPGTHKLTGITGPGAQTFGYDAVGNITSKNTQTLIYNLNNRLIQITDQGSTVGEYVYNGKGQRIKKIVGTDTTIYHYDLAGNLIGESDATGVFTAQYIYLGAERLVAVAASETSEVEVQVSTDAGRNLAGIRVYAFTDTEAYTGKYATTGEDGKATFTLSEFTDGDYKFRADYLGDQFWSPVIAVPGVITTDVTIAEEATTVQVTQGGEAKQGVKVYLFNETGTYLGLYQTSDVNGEVTFILPEAQEYTFRADIMGGQFFSETVSVVDGGTTLAIDSGGGLLTLNLSKGVDLPMEGIKTYLFTASGSYLGQSETTDALGQAGYAVPSGSYKIRSDYLGYQFWTNVTGVTTDAGINLEIPHQDVVITVAGVDDGDVQEREGLKTYLFTSSGSYLGINATTDANGQVTFNLPAREYKVRADYLSQQFWSDVFIQQNTDITIAECRAEVLVTRLNNPLEGVPTYVFSESGSYLSLNGTSDTDGKVTYRLPAGTYNIRGDYLGSQYFSGHTVLVADQANPVKISTGGGKFTLTVEKAPGQPMESIKSYLFTEAGSYLGHTTTTNGQGEAPFELADGTYKIRTDYLGYQFWTPLFTVPDTGALTHTMAHSDVAITVEKQNGAVSEAIEGVKVYLFTPSGGYQGVNSTTDAQGQVTFSLPAADYKVRADYLSGKYWSGVFNQAAQTIAVSEGTASITVSGGGTNLAGVKVYVFTATGSYLGINGTTDVKGLVEFILPSGDYKFRADYQGSQYWATETVVADQVNAFDLDTGGGTFVLTVQKAAGVPMLDVPVYVFSQAGSYLGFNARTDGSGQVSFSLSKGSYMFRVDYLGYKFWSSVSVMPEILSDALTIEHTDVAVSVNEVYGVDSDPLEGITVYLFTESGAYQGQNAQTNADGQVMFNLPDKDYKVRADYLGGQHWSGVFTSVNTSVDIDIDHGYANLHVTDTGTDVVDAPVYLFTQAGSYLGRMQRTDAGGLTSFLLPAGAYKFRVDTNGTQYWSDVVNILASEETVVDLALDLLAMDSTRNPHPVRFDGTPPKHEPVMLASLMNITGILNQTVVAATGPDALYWFINDHLGTPQKLIDSDQVVVWEGSQEPFGNTTLTTDTVGNNLRFPGQYFDTESGFHYNYHRYYDPSIGRYITPDPIGLAGMDPNLYGYVLNNPANDIDPFGLHGIMLFGRGPWYINIPRHLRTPYKHIPRDLPKQQPFKQPRYVPKPTPDLTPKGNWFSRFLKNFADWLGELGIGGLGGAQIDPCEKPADSNRFNIESPTLYYHHVYNPGGII